MAAENTPRILRSKSMAELQDQLNSHVLRESYHNLKRKGNNNKTKLLPLKENDDDEKKDVDDEDEDDDNDTIAHTTYKMPLEFVYHDHKFIFIDKPSKDCKELVKFHKTLDKYQTSIFERYGWKPSIDSRIEIDCNACLLGFAINDETQDIMAMLTLFDVSDSPEKCYKIEKELSLTVLPPFQRRHIATDLVRLSWNLFAHPIEECWIYVMNSRKSGMFWRKFKQWYPAVKFRLVKP